jgi:signal transduction histidine kinase
MLVRGAHHPAGDGEARKRTGAIRDLTAQMDRLRQDLLDVAAIEAGRLSFEPVDVDVGVVVGEAVAGARRALGREGRGALRLGSRPACRACGPTASGCCRCWRTSAETR